MAWLRPIGFRSAVNRALPKSGRETQFAANASNFGYTKARFSSQIARTGAELKPDKKFLFALPSRTASTSTEPSKMDARCHHYDDGSCGSGFSQPERKH